MGKPEASPSGGSVAALGVRDTLLELMWLLLKIDVP
jgi:hypothetical protein